MKQILQLFTVFLIALTSCHKFEHDNVFDPASDKYSPPVAPHRVIVVDFEKDSTRSIWGYRHNEFSKNKGQIIKTYATEASVQNKMTRVIRLDYDVSNNDSSDAGWVQPLCSTDDGAFNAKTMGLKSLTFFARGAAGGEQFLVTMTDENGNNTEEAPRPVLTNSWKQYRIPLSSLTTLQSGSIDLRKITSFDFTFYKGLGPSRGTIFVDEFAFEWE